MICLSDHGASLFVPRRVRYVSKFLTGQSLGYLPSVRQHTKFVCVHDYACVPYRT
jgi:hypothetical protein